VLLAVAWDSLSPIDTRKLSVRSRRSDPIVVWFEVERAKAGRAALATLSRRTAALLATYLAALPAARRCSATGQGTKSLPRYPLRGRVSVAPLRLLRHR
jgi:hypothetical protein